MSPKTLGDEGGGGCGGCGGGDDDGGDDDGGDHDDLTPAPSYERCHLVLKLTRSHAMYTHTDGQTAVVLGDPRPPICCCEGITNY